MEFYNSEIMRTLRLDLLNGQQPSGCQSCYYEESFGKLSGRKRQLLKSVVNVSDFELNMRASPHYDMFKHSYENNGNSTYMPVDLQIDLGNICNSACIMCKPHQSSKLFLDYKKLNKLNPSMFAAPEKYTSWTEDDELVDRFVDQMAELPNIGYIHFLGGETLYDRAFFKICDRLIETKLAANVIIGTTTNGTVYNEKIERYAKEFKQFHLGISIETVNSLNDYIRYPGKIDQILDNIAKFKDLRQHSNLIMSLRITPNIFTISEFDLMAEYMIENDIIAESCNILARPSVLRMELLPNDIKQETIEKLERVVEKYNLQKQDIVNVRNPNISQRVISDVVLDYVNFLKNMKAPDDVEQERHRLVSFIKTFEQLRQNKITDYAPRYQDFLRTYGY